MLKAQLHIHINEDPEDNIDYSIYEVIETAKKQKFDIIAITMHDKYFKNPKAIKYAKNKGIILIPGIEKRIQKKHVLIYNANKKIEKIETFKELSKYKENNPNCLIIAPHPFYYVKECLKSKIKKHLNLFDAWEFSFFYCKLINPNMKLIKRSKMCKKPVIGTSDVHDLNYFSKTYTLIDAKKNTIDIINAIKNNKVGIVTSPLKIKEILYIIAKMIKKK
jgi:predicted metal-dependent phosphoesterase TrpH